MSRTDKDVPYRVHLARRGRVKHDHRFGPCDLEDWTPERYWVIRQRGTSCRRVEGNDYIHETLPLFPRSKKVQLYRDKDLGRERGDLRRQAGNVRKLANAGEDLTGEEIVSSQHRHNALWEAW